MSQIKQYFTEERMPDGSVRRSFTDHFGPDLDAYICNSYAIFNSYLDFHEDPEAVEFQLQEMSAGDFELAEDHKRHEIPFSQLQNKEIRNLGIDAYMPDDVEDIWTGDD
jgi:hypothetical protein